MSLLAFGVNHSTAPVEIQERVAFVKNGLNHALCDLSQQPGIDEAAILSTCNRTEIYCSLDSIDNTGPYDWFYNYHHLEEHRLRPYVHRYPDVNAVRHLLRVASGLDSMVLGETQVLGQLKQAYHSAVAAGSVGQLLSRLFQHSFHVAKEVRGNTAIGNHPVSVAFAAVRLARQFFGDLSKQTVLLIGAGETIGLVARHLHENGLRRMIIANRTVERSWHLANEYSGYAIPFADIPHHLVEADVIISATASQQPVLSRDAVAAAIRRRKRRLMFLVDTAVPRDIEPEVGDLDDVYLYTIDDLKDIVRDNLHARKQAAEQAEKIIDTQVDNFMDWLQSRNAVATIRALRRQAETIQRQVLETAQRRLQRGADPQTVLLETARILTKKLIHTPSVQLRVASIDGRDDLLAAVEELFALDTEARPNGKKSN